MTWKTVAVVFGVGLLVLVCLVIGSRRMSEVRLLITTAVTLGIPCLILLGMRYGQSDNVIEVVDHGDTLRVTTSWLGSGGNFTVPKGPPTNWHVKSVKEKRVDQTYLTFEHQGRTYALNVANPDVFDVEAFRRFAPDAVDAVTRTKSGSIS